MSDRTWVLSSKGISEVIRAEDQWGAWDTLRDRPVEDFGLVVTAEPDEMGEDEAIPVRTDTLMTRWGRLFEAEQFHDRAVELGLITP